MSRLYLFTIPLIISLGVLSGLSVATQSAWYTSLTQPSWAPPAYWFGPVWTLLYALLGIVLSRLWQHQHTSDLSLFALQMLANLAWSPLFFGAQRPGWAALLLLGILGCTLKLMLQTKDRCSRYLLTPYALWLCYAWSLNLGILWLN